MDVRRSIILALALSAIACSDPVEGLWEGGCEGDDEPATWELTLEGDGTGVLEASDSNGDSGDAEVEWEASGGGYDLELDWGGGKKNDWECELEDDGEALQCELVRSSHEAVCDLDREE